ncbi:MAG: HAD hydrolase family protein [Myxococcales bacterium]|nr:HAD hydrolase family protein [Myxococcales bacterium]MCB9732669.1 HAD hydrolase family protein [Deltaproteobacteria bacterium]
MTGPGQGDGAPRGVLFVDLDGTLVGAGGVAERVWPALAALRAAGFRVAICTGRPGRGLALAYAQRVDVDGLHVFESGAVVMDGHGRVHAFDALPGPAVARVVALGAGHGATVEAYTADGRYLAAERDALIAGHEELLGFAADIAPLPPAEPVVRVQWVLPQPGWPALRAAADAVDALAGIAPHEGTSPKMPGIAFVSLTAAGVSKGLGVRRVLDAYGLTREQAAMAGDNKNDLAGFAAVGRVFVAADGAPEALAVATDVIPGPAAGGVADAAMALLAG